MIRKIHQEIFVPTLIHVTMHNMYILIHCYHLFWLSTEHLQIQLSHTWGVIAKLPRGSPIRISVPAKDRIYMNMFLKNFKKSLKMKYAFYNHWFFSCVPKRPPAPSNSLTPPHFLAWSSPKVKKKSTIKLSWSHTKFRKKLTPNEPRIIFA